MSLFDKDLGNTNKKNEEQQQQLPIHKEDWEYYVRPINNIRVSILVDMGFAKVAPIAGKPNMIWVSIEMENPTEHWCPNKEESTILESIEANLVDSLVSKHNSVYVGWLTTKGKRTFYFYLGNTTTYDKTISESMLKFPSYKFEFQAKEDKLCNGYFNALHPTPDQIQMIKNARIIRALEKEGDDLTSERMVNHCAYFRDDADAQDYIHEIKKMNFQVLSEKIKDTTSVFKYEVNFGRIDKIDPASLNEYMLYLWKLAYKKNGYYGNWSCISVKK